MTDLQPMRVTDSELRLDDAGSAFLGAIAVRQLTMPRGVMGCKRGGPVPAWLSGRNFLGPFGLALSAVLVRQSGCEPAYAWYTGVDVASAVRQCLEARGG
ncbi:hypothetical protein GCM10022255_112360 [Dactylosporangium darangshiense]|uniref:Uncharacterized protein n=1 Tax=Dactylosporangium darangshiense TaxID=579108 RepID=A0ABP8DV30_9ACTN